MADSADAWAQTVLVVNDTRDQVHLMAHMLRLSGYGVLVAHDGQEALDAAQAHRPDAIVSDVMMPRMDGIALCRAIRADAELRDTPVLLVSAVRRDSESAVEGFGAGADDYLEVPYDPSRLLARVARLIERRRAARESEAEWRALFAALADLVLVLDVNGRYLKVAPTRAGIAYRPESELVGRHLHDVLPAVKADLFLDHIRRALARRMPVSLDYTLDIGGTPISFEATVSPLTDDTVFWVARDVTEQLSLREKLLQAQKMEAVGRLAGGIAHDFNNLLTVISGFGGLVADALQPGSRVRRHAEEVLQAAARATTLTSQLLAFSRKQVLQPIVLDLNLVVANVESMLRRVIGEDIDLQTSLPAGIGRVHADRSQVEQVLMNLAVNARDAMPQGGRLTIETSRARVDDEYAQQHPPMRPGEYVTCVVTDTGVGMDEDVRAHLFEPFFTTKGPGQGTGLGLATVYGIVKQSGGYIWAYSEPGHGSTFTIYLPAVEMGASAELERGAEGGSDGPLGTETILLVEDNAQLRALAAAVLDRNGYTVLAAGRGDEALQAAAAHPGPVHLLVSDVVMPGMGGRALAEHVQRQCPGVRVLFMSGYPDESIVHRGVLEPGTHFLQKPFMPRALAQKVRDVLDS